MQRHIPLVLAGGTVLHPFESWAAETVPQPHGVVDACERAAAKPLPVHTAVAKDAAVLALMNRGLDPHADVTVRRRHGGLAVEIDTPAPLDHDARGMVSVRVLAALRNYDHETRNMDVAFTT
jgi:hypothetical protein